MITIPGRIPITIHPFFWITALLIGFLSSQSLPGTMIWVVVILVSVIVHELGHATTALFFGLTPRIDLVALGGLTTHQGGKLSSWKQFFIVLNGPLFGFMLFIAAWLLLKMQFQGVMLTFLNLFYLVNLIWTILNLVPVLPLDGGQLMRIVLEAVFGAKGFKYSLLIGIVVSTALSLLFFFFQNFLIGALFFLFAFQSFDLYRRMRNLSEEDRSDKFKEALEEAERDLQSGNKERALSEFERVRAETKEGMIHMLATQYLAFLKYEKGQVKETYDLLTSIRKDLSGEALCLLHKAAFDQKDYSLVTEIGPNCFQVMPVKEVALRNAFASGSQGLEKPAIGWLEAAFQDGLENIPEILKEPYFDPIRDSTLFKQFQKIHLK